MFKPLLLSAALGLAFCAQANADDTSNGWSGESSFTGSNTTGNTKTTDVGLGLKINKDGDLWHHTATALVDYGKSAGTKNKQRFALGYQLDRDFNDRVYGFGTGDYFNDDFGAYEEGYYFGTGLGYRAVLPSPLAWNLEGGIGYRSQSLQTTGKSENDFALRGGSDLDYAFNDNVSLYNDTEITYSSSDTYIWNEIGVTAELFGNLAGRASFRVDNHSDVPKGTKKTDTITRVGVVYTMK